MVGFEVVVDEDQRGATIIGKRPKHIIEQLTIAAGVNEEDGPTQGPVGGQQLNLIDAPIVVWPERSEIHQHDIAAPQEFGHCQPPGVVEAE
ncbi:MAG: hypothetical protein M3N43_05410, partial [Actinomycetota bacterium]|nr:hypothetical protein [Actinomycetota bacterium]